MSEETASQPDSPSVNPLAPVVELVERAFNRFSRLFSTLFPWMVLFCLGGFVAALTNHASPLWQQITLNVVGIVVILISYLASARIIADVEKEPRDIIGNLHTVFTLFFPYLWLIILQGLIFLGGAIFVVPFIIFSVFLAVMFFVFVAEDQRGLSVLTRSWSYVTDRWWATLWRMIVLLFLILVAMMVLGLILSLGFGITGGHASSSLGAILINQLFSAFLIMPWFLCYLFELYQDLRATKPVLIITDEKTARLWLVIFLTIGIILALLMIFDGVFSHTAAQNIMSVRY